MEYQFNNNNPFEYDKIQKELAGKALVKMGEENGITVLTAETENPMDRVDIKYTAITKSHKEMFGIVEVKGRSVPYQWYPDEFVNPEKLDNEEVNGYISSGYTFLWAAVYKDKVVLWDTKKADKTSKAYNIKKYTVLEGEKIPQTRYCFHWDDAIRTYDISSL